MKMELNPFDLLSMIAERKLSIAFSKYIVQVIDPTSPGGTVSYIEYHAEPQANNAQAKVKVFASRDDALMSALLNCFQRVRPPEGEAIVITREGATQCQRGCWHNQDTQDH